MTFGSVSGCIFSNHTPSAPTAPPMAVISGQHMGASDGGAVMCLLWTRLTASNDPEQTMAHKHYDAA